MRTAAFFLMASIALCLGQHLDELKITSGQVYKDVYVYNADNDAVYIKYGPHYQGVKIPWRMIPQDRQQELNQIANKIHQEEKSERLRSAAQVSCKFKISQIAQNGALVNIISLQKGNDASFDPNADTTAFIYGDFSQNVDGEVLSMDLYFAGNYQYETVLGATRTVYALSTTFREKR